MAGNSLCLSEGSPDEAPPLAPEYKSCDGAVSVQRNSLNVIMRACTPARECGAERVRMPIQLQYILLNSFFLLKSFLL